MLELMLTMSTWYFGWLLSMFYPPVSYWVNYNKKIRIQQPNDFKF